MMIKKLPYRPCVGIVLLNRDGLIFVGQRIDSAKGAWQMPQGGVDKGEDPQTAALRELTEETGVTPDLVEVLGASPDWYTYDLPEHLVPKIWGGRFRGQKQRWFLLRYLGGDNQVNIATAHPEFSEWRWLPAREVIAHIVPFKRDTYTRVFRDFDMHLA